MGIEYLLVKDETRETYDLGKFTGGWARLIAAPGSEDAAERGHHFVVHQDAGVVADFLAEDWAGAVVITPGYLRRVAEDILRWAGTALVRLSSDASHDGWRGADGSRDEGRRTGSRYAEDHPEWARVPRA